jgi:hypothetical protein
MYQTSPGKGIFWWKGLFLPGFVRTFQSGIAVLMFFSQRLRNSFIFLLRIKYNEPVVVKYQNNFLKFFGLAFLLIILAAMIIQMMPGLIYGQANPTEIGLLNNLFIALCFGAELLFLAGNYSLAKAKGYNGWTGFFLGITIFGLAILMLLPDRVERG